MNGQTFWCNAQYSNWNGREDVPYLMWYAFAYDHPVEGNLVARAQGNSFSHVRYKLVDKLVTIQRDRDFQQQYAT
jgi:hypothetical protein